MKNALVTGQAGDDANLTAARSAFSPLSRKIVRYRETRSWDRPVVILLDGEEGAAPARRPRACFCVSYGPRKGESK